MFMTWITRGSDSAYELVVIHAGNMGQVNHAPHNHVTRGDMNEGRMTAKRIAFIHLSLSQTKMSVTSTL